MNTVKKNFIYNLMYHILILIIPLITAPYISRIIGVNGVGVYSYTYSIVYYFMLLVILGLNNYGNRSIAKVRDDKNKLSKTFLSIYSFQIIMGIIMVVFFLIYLCCFAVDYKNIFLIDTLFIISAMFDINWFFFGMEKFKVTIIRNLIVKIMSLLLIFIFVRKPGDLWIYTLIMALTTLISQLLIWPYLLKEISIVKISKSDILKHIKPNLVLFLPIIAISIYKIMDKIMLGILTNIDEVGYYENAEKIVQLPTTIISTLGAVMLPRISNIISKNKIEEAKIYIGKSIYFVMFLSYAMMFGLIAIGKDFAPIFYGLSFEKTGTLIALLSITIPFLSFASVIRTHFLIPAEKDKIYVVSVFMGAIINLIMNIIFIPKYKSIGACFGTISAEAVVMIYQCLKSKEFLPISYYIKNTSIFLLKSIVMFIIIMQINHFSISNLEKIIIQILLGVFIYALLNYKYINSFRYKKLKR